MGSEFVATREALRTCEEKYLINGHDCLIVSRFFEIQLYEKKIRNQVGEMEKAILGFENFRDSIFRASAKIKSELAEEKEKTLKFDTELSKFSSLSKHFIYFFKH